MAAHPWIPQFFAAAEKMVPEWLDVCGGSAAADVSHLLERREELRSGMPQNRRGRDICF